VIVGHNAALCQLIVYHSKLLLLAFLILVSWNTTRFWVTIKGVDWRVAQARVAVDWGRLGVDWRVWVGRVMG